MCFLFVLFLIFWFFTKFSNPFRQGNILHFRCSHRYFCRYMEGWWAIGTSTGCLSECSCFCAFIRIPVHFCAHLYIHISICISISTSIHPWDICVLLGHLLVCQYLVHLFDRSLHLYIYLYVCLLDMEVCLDVHSQFNNTLDIYMVIFVYHILHMIFKTSMVVLTVTLL